MIVKKYVWKNIRTTFDDNIDENRTEFFDATFRTKSWRLEFFNEEFDSEEDAIVGLQKFTESTGRHYENFTLLTVYRSEP